VDKKNKQRARAYHEADLSREESESEEISVETEGIAEAPPVSRSGKISRLLFGIFFSAWNNKWTVSAIMLPIAVLTIVGLTLGFGWPGKERIGPPIQRGDMILQEPLSEESLSPFFIPLSVDGNRKMVRVDLTVIWSVLASVKYRKNEIRIRDQMLHHLSSLTRENRDLTTGPDWLENDLRGILQASLGIYNLEVKVREIKYF